MRVDSSGIIRDSLWVSADGRATVVDLGNVRGGSLMILPLVKDAPELRVSSTGRSRVVVERYAPRSARRTAFRVTLFTDALDTLATSAVPFTPVRLDRESADSMRNLRLHRLRAAVANGTMPANVLTKVEAELKTPEFYPPVDWVALGADDRVWLRLSPSAGLERQWMSLDVRKRQYDVIVASPRAQMVEAIGSFVWSVEFGANDEPELVMYRKLPLRKP